MFPSFCVCTKHNKLFLKYDDFYWHVFRRISGERSTCLRESMGVERGGGQGNRRHPKGPSCLGRRPPLDRLLSCTVRWVLSGPCWMRDFCHCLAISWAIAAVWLSRRKERNVSLDLFTLNAWDKSHWWAVDAQSCEDDLLLSSSFCIAIKLLLQVNTFVP